MALKIQPQSISVTAEKISNNHTRKKSKVKNPTRLSEGISFIAGQFFWLPVFKMLVKAELIDKQLNSGKFMTDNGFAITYGEATQVKADTYLEPYFLTYMGLDFLYNLISDVARDNWQYAPVLALIIYIRN